MAKHRVGTREEWLQARLELLEAEKEHTRRSDELAHQRRQLPWVPIEKDYRFETADGPASLRDLFRGRSQLLVQHFMFPGCPSCSSMADGCDGAYTEDDLHDGRPPHNMHVNWDHTDTPAEMYPRYEGIPDPHDMPPKDAQGMSAFALEDDVVYHTYSAYARGVDVLWNMFQWLDRAPLGRNESGRWYKLHDEYEDTAAASSDSA